MIEAITACALVVLILALAYGWHAANREAEYYREHHYREWAALLKIAGDSIPRNNGSAMKRIAREALEGGE